MATLPRNYRIIHHVLSRTTQNSSSSIFSSSLSSSSSSSTAFLSTINTAVPLSSSSSSSSVPLVTPSFVRSSSSSSSASGLRGVPSSSSSSSSSSPTSPTSFSSTQPYLSYVESVRASALLRSRVHLGHQHNRLNTKLTGYLQGYRHNIDIYDINKIWRSMRTIFYGFAEMAHQRSSFFLLAPNDNLPLRKIIEHLRAQYPFRHDRFGSLYLTGYSDKKWIDGIFSNWKVTYEYSRHVKDILEKKPALKKYRKLRANLKGVEGAGLYTNMLPDFVLVLATDRGALHEARNADIPLFGLVDTNTDPTPFLYPVFANDDSVESIQFFLDLVKRGIEEGRKREQEAFALLMIRKLKQTLDPARGSAFNIGGTTSATTTSKTGNTAVPKDNWTVRPSNQAERPAWLNKLDLSPNGGNVKLDQV